MASSRTAAATAARVRPAMTKHDVTAVGYFVADFVHRLERGPLYLTRGQVVDMLNEAAQSLRPKPETNDV
jgi:hypothetical protein